MAQAKTDSIFMVREAFELSYMQGATLTGWCVSVISILPPNQNQAIATAQAPAAANDRVEVRGAASSKPNIDRGRRLGSFAWEHLIAGCKFYGVGKPNQSICIKSPAPPLKVKQRSMVPGALVNWVTKVWNLSQPPVLVI